MMDDILMDILLPLYAGTGREKELIDKLGGNVDENELEAEKLRRRAKGDTLQNLFDAIDDMF